MRSHVIDEPHNKTNRKGDQEQERDHAKEFSFCYCCVRTVISTDRSRVRVNKADTVNDQLHTKCSDEGRNL